ncbi:MAG: nicotinate-nucleotide--dimethylbenzimidazole phosphoribosyltransferase [Halobacteriaceae archaeon]
MALVAGTTRTARIDGISAAGADADLRDHTPSADAELLAYGRPVYAPAVPVSPTGCPTPALVTRAVRELVGFEATTVDAGLAEPTAAPTVGVGADPGGDIREPGPVPGAAEIIEKSIKIGKILSDSNILVGETVPGGTTTALGVLAALGDRFGVSSSLPENPVALKAEVVEAGLAASDLAPGDAAGRPVVAVREMGDPVLAAAFGLARGAIDAGVRVTLAGGTQMLAVAGLLRHAGVDAPLTVATTSYVADDDTAEVRAAADAFDVDLAVTDPGFGGADHPVARYARGEAKEGAGMGGALMRAEREGVPMAAVRERVRTLYGEVVDGA